MIKSSLVMKAFMNRSSSSSGDSGSGTTKKTVETSSSITSNNNDYAVVDTSNGGRAAAVEAECSNDELFLRLRSEALQVVEWVHGVQWFFFHWNITYHTDPYWLLLSFSPPPLVSTTLQKRTYASPPLSKSRSNRRINLQQYSHSKPLFLQL